MHGHSEPCHTLPGWVVAPAETGLRDCIVALRACTKRPHPDQLQQALNGEKEGAVLSTSPFTLSPSNGGLSGPWCPSIGQRLCSLRWLDWTITDHPKTQAGPRKRSFQESALPREGQRTYSVMSQLYKAFLQEPERRKRRWTCVFRL